MTDNCERLNTWTAKQRIDAFKEEYISVMMSDPHVTDVRFLGSAHETWRWRQGHSNVDIIVDGDSIPFDVKLKGVKLLAKLNYKYCLGLEKVPYYHPTPFYGGNRVAHAIGDLGPGIQKFTDPGRSLMKRLGEGGHWPINHGNFWKRIDNMPRLLQRLLVL